MKFLTKYLNKEEFFYKLKDGEIFMYSYHDFKWEDISNFAKAYKIQIEQIKKGTEDYKQYGECAAKLIGRKTKVFSFSFNSNESIEIEAHSEEKAKIKLVDILFSKGYIKLEKLES